MGSLLFDYLHDTPLFDAARLADQFSALSDAELLKELERYREFVDNHIEALRKEVTDTPGALKLVAEGGRAGRTLLTQTAWYAHQFILHDPVYGLGAPRPVLTAPMEQLLGIERSDVLDRSTLVAALRLLKELTPMVAANVVKLLPLGRLFEPPAELPMLFSPTGFADSLPPELMEWMRARAQVHPVAVVDGRVIARVAVNALRTPQRSIGVQFGEEPDGPHYFYNLLRQEIRKFDPSTGHFQSFSYLPEEPPTRGEYDAWVAQSVHQAARDAVGRVYAEMVEAESVGARYLAVTAFTADLLSRDARPISGIPEATLNTLLSLDVPFVNVDLETLIRIRQDEGEPWERFRLELEKQFREIQLEDDPEKAALKARNAAHEITEVMVRDVAAKVKSLRVKGLIESAVGVAGLLGSVATAGWSLSATVGAALAGAKTAAEYRSGLREHPGYFAWRVRDASYKRRGPLKGL